ncbi:hypothetical protein Scep_024483 [Stephania cephalantha]|uniref:Uncharacterized protein n=1 Tax=Stephania cephalantha TaxID=152367 RepID=A0AAP0HTQ7_9MAGN
MVIVDIGVSASERMLLSDKDLLNVYLSIKKQTGQREDQRLPLSHWSAVTYDIVSVLPLCRLVRLVESNADKLSMHFMIS